MMLPRWRKPAVTTRHVEALGLAVVVVGIGLVWLPGGIIAAGGLLILGALIRSMGRGE